MAKRRRKRIPVVRPSVKIAASPGTLTAHSGGTDSSVSVIAYGPEKLLEEEISDLSQLKTLGSSYPVVWINIIGLGSLDILTEVGEQLGLHRLALEDVLNIPQRPKLDDYGDHQFIVARMPVAHEHLETEQLSIFLGKSFVLTVQERPGDCFAGIRQRIHNGRPGFRLAGPDYLTYAILDALVDSYFPLLEGVSATLEELETEINHKPEKRHIEHLHSLKHEMVTLRRYLWPLRELNATLLRPDNTFFTEKTRLFMRDCYDHTIHALDLVESYREIASGLMELYLSMMSQKMNEVMKVLTIIATVFIPLSFIAGLYGMNFNPEVSRWNMPELGWPLGYPMALGIMAVCAGGMLIFFWKKGWFR